MTVSTDLLDRARAWAADDPDATTRAEVEALVAAATADPDGPEARDLADRFAGTLEFGTAGLRGALGGGPNRMNRAVVIRAAAGLAAYLKDNGAGPDAAVVIGFDARHYSDVFAQDTAAVMRGAGLRALLLPRPLPTPVLAYAIRKLGCVAGVMVTASHNPPQDNGYKVYLGRHAVPENGNGAQIVTPYDASIAARINAVGPLESITLAHSGWTVLDASIAADYERATAALAMPGGFPARDLSIVLTPLHGVGGGTALAVLNAAGFKDITLVAEQAEPDPDFPTVSFPNPEEPGALDLALESAERRGADIVIANDPDADRAAVAAKDPDTGAWRMLRGDEVGALLGAHIAARIAAGKAKDDAGTEEGAQGVFANSIVSSRLLARIATAAGYAHQETLTGFKWISRVPGLVYGYEEALGYCVAPDLVRDKDGISAALLIAELAAAAKADGKTVFDTLDELYLQHGLHASDQLSIRVADLGLLDAMMNRLRVSPPETFGSSAVEVYTDLAAGTNQLPPTDGLLYVTRDLTRVIIRPSGTEPKLKCYLEVIQHVGSAAELPAARQAARAALDEVLRDVSEALGL